MEWFLRHKLSKISKKANPSRDFVLSLEKRLKQETSHGLWWIQWSKVATSVACVSVVLGSGTGVYAYTSDEVLPEHPLYGIREQIEHVETKFAFSDQAKAQNELKLLKRRFNEAQKLEALNRPLQAAKLEKLAKRVQQVSQKIGMLNPEIKQSLDQSVQRLKQKQIMLIEKTEQKTTVKEERQRIHQLLMQERANLREQRKEFFEQRRQERHLTP
ncbi:hypothetical protein IT408_01850 [Candidatus Uhrbacteria bacterium]|nr:hypothetical protein [Candidatus Uhrbacteria bacterium]